MKARLEQLNAAVAEQNKRAAKEGQPETEQYMVVKKGAASAGAKPKAGRGPLPGFDYQPVHDFLRSGWDAFGELLDVKSRPKAESLEMQARSVVTLSQYYDLLSPKYIALGVFIQATIACGAPMAKEFKVNFEAKRAKKVQGRDEKIKPPETAPQAPVPEPPPPPKEPEDDPRLGTDRAPQADAVQTPPPDGERVTV